MSETVDREPVFFGVNSVRVFQVQNGSLVKEVLGKWAFLKSTENSELRN
jgi:hypothetical protein